MNTDTTLTLDHEDKPDLQWKLFWGRFFLAIVAVVSGTLASHFAETSVHFALVAGLAGISALIMIAVIAPRRGEDEFDRTISMQAGTFAGLATVVFLVLDQLHLHLTGDTVVALLGLPGFYLMQWLVMSQYLRWNFSRGAN